MTDRKAARDALSKVLSQIGDLEALVSDFQGDNAGLQVKLCSNEYVDGLKALHGVAASLHRKGGEPYELPVELLRYLDDGGNPDVFTAEVMRSCQAANEASRGKVEAFRAWRDSLAVKLEVTYPDVMADYKALPRSNPPGQPSVAPG